MISVLVTGANGQLGRSISDLTSKFSGIDFTFKDSRSLDITNQKSVDSFFSSKPIDYCINCAAFTNVELAEKNREPAFDVNAKGVRNLALACKAHRVKMIHISTDYVFDGEKVGAYLPNDVPNPINEYGKSKLEGENYILQILNQFFIIRTSWLYSSYGKNFYKTIIEKARKGESLKITNAQLGCPTHAGSLASFLLELVVNARDDFGIYQETENL